MKQQKRYKDLFREYEEEQEPEFDFEGANLGEVRKAEAEIEDGDE